MGVNTTKSRETFATTLVCLIAGVGLQPIHTPSSSQIQVPSGTPSVTQSRGPFDYIVIILMENKNYADIVGNPMAPYINRLARDYGINSNYYDVSRNGSLPNYLGLTTSQTYHSWSTCNQPPSKCPGFVPVSSRTIIDSVEHAGLTWKAYMEDAPSNCYQYDSGLYAVRHDPFVYFARVQNSMLECNRVVPAGSQADLLIADLGSFSSASNFMWLTPNLCDDMHNCSVSSGDHYLSQIIPRILNSDVFLTGKAALFLTWDEGQISTPTNIPAIWAGPAVRNNFTSSNRYDHYSFVKTVEMAWHLPFLTSNDAESSAMTEFFAGPRLGLTYYPTQPQPNETVNFYGRATGGSSPYIFKWSFGDGRIATGEMTAHQYRATGSYEVALSVTDAFNTTALSVTMINVSHIPISQIRPSFLSWLLGVIPMTITTASTLITVAGGLLVGRFLGRKKTPHP